MGELGIVLVVDSSIDGYARAARLIPDAWTSLWAPTPSTIARWKSFLSPPPVALVMRLDRWTDDCVARLCAVQAEFRGPVVVQLGVLDPSAVAQLHALGVRKVLPMLCSPSTMESALVDGTWEYAAQQAPSLPMQLAV